VPRPLAIACLEVPQWHLEFPSAHVFFSFWSLQPRHKEHCGGFFLQPMASSASCGIFRLSF